MKILLCILLLNLTAFAQYTVKQDSQVTLTWDYDPIYTPLVLRFLVEQSTNGTEWFVIDQTDPTSDTPMELSMLVHFDGKVKTIAFRVSAVDFDSVIGEPSLPVTFTRQTKRMYE